MSGNRSKFGSNVKHSNNCKRHNRRESVSMFRAELEPALMVVDVPNIHSLWYGAQEGKTHNIRFPYRLLGNAYRNYLSWKYKNRRENETYFEVGSAVFLNERENQDYEFFDDLRDNHGWFVFKKPKLSAEDDIDENIKAYIGFMLEEKPYMHVMLVGNDLKNHIPIAKDLLGQNINVTMLVANNHFYPSTLWRLERMPREIEKELGINCNVENPPFQVLDLKEFFAAYCKKRPVFPW